MYLSMDTWVDAIILAVGNHAAKNVGVQISLRYCNCACFSTKEWLIVKAQGFDGLVPVSL